MCLSAARPATTGHQEPGTCPCCGGGFLTYGSTQLRDSNYGYDWTCDECGAEGQEWFTLVFSEHIVKKPGEVVYDLATEHPTWTWGRWAYYIENDGRNLTYTEWVAANIAAGPKGLG